MVTCVGWTRTHRTLVRAEFLSHASRPVLRLALHAAAATAAASAAATAAVSFPIRRWPVTTPQALRDWDVVEQAFEHRVFRLLRRVETCLSEDVKRGFSTSQAWNRALVEASSPTSFFLSIALSEPQACPSVPPVTEGAG